MPAIPVPAFSLDDLLAELLARPRAPEGYLTLEEWSEQLKLSKSQVRRLLRLAKQQGELAVARREIEALDGRRCTVPVYAFVLQRKGA